MTVHKKGSRVQKTVFLVLLVQTFLTLSIAGTLTVHESPQGEELTDYTVNGENPVYLKYSSSELSGGDGYLNVTSSATSKELNVTLRDDGQLSDNGTDGDYWGSFDIVSGDKTPSEGQIKVLDGEDANISVYFRTADSINTSVNISADYTSPEVKKISVPDYFSSSDTTVNLTSFFSVSGSSDTVYSYEVNTTGTWKITGPQSFDPTELGSGATVKFRANATDQAGNYRANETSKITVDTVKPNLNGASRWNDNDGLERTEIALRVSDKVSGVKDNTVSDGNLEIIPGKIDRVALGDFILMKNPVDAKYVDVNITGTIQDKAGNELSSGTVTACCMGKKPVIENASIDTEGSVTADDAVDVSAVVTDNVEVDNVSVEAGVFGREKVWMYDENNDNNFTARFNVGSKSELSGDGLKELDIVANDTNSNRNSTTTDAITVDTTPPSLDGFTQVNRNGSDEWADEGDEIIVKLNVSDATSILSVSANASEFNSTLELSESGETSDYRGVFEVGEPAEDGEKKIKVALEDSLGNSETVNLDPVGVDNSPPIVSVAKTGDSGGYSSSREEIKIGFVDEVSGLEEKEINKSFFKVENKTIESITVYRDYQSTENPVQAHIELEEDLETDSRPEIQFNRTLKDRAGNEVVNSSFEASDGLRPYPEEGAFFDTDRDGRVDQIKVNFTEEITYENPDKSDWYLSDGRLNLYMDGWTIRENRITINTSTALMTSGTVEPVSLRYDEYQNGKLQDLNGNNPSRSRVYLKDRADPVIRFQEGINMVSLPSRNGRYRVNEVLEGGGENISGIKSIWRYVDGEWQSYVPGRDTNEFTYLEGGRGYVLKAEKSGKIVEDVDQPVEGSEKPSGQTIHKDRWNLVGTYGENSVELGQEIINRMFTLERDSTAVKSVLKRIENGAFSLPREMRPGKAYWVSTAENTLYTW